MDERQPAESMLPEQKQILRKKLQLMQIWCVFLYNVEHRIIMNVISYHFLAGQEVTLRTIQPYRNSLNIVTELRDGFLVSLIQKKADKTSIVRMNPNFFILLPRIMEMIKAQINPQLQKIKQFNPLEKKKICTNCKTQKTEQQLKFMGVRCQCATPNFVDIKQDRQKKERLEQIQHLLRLAILKRKQIDDLQNTVQKIIRQKRDQKQKKLSDFQRFCEKFKLDASSTTPKIQKNYETLTQAFKLFAPKNNYKRIDELTKIRQARRN